MDYLDEDKIKFYKSSEGFFESKKNDRVILITTKSKNSYTDFNYNANDTMLFGRESVGVPEHIHKLVNERLKIPMFNNKRSLNLSTSVAIVLAENMRQINRI